MRPTGLILATVLVLGGCSAWAGPANGGAPSGSTGKPPAAAASAATSTKKTDKTSGSPKAGKPTGALSFDPFAADRCDWVARLIVDLSGKAKPGVRVRIPVWAAALDRTVTLTVGVSLNGPGNHTSDTITASPPEWRGAATVSFAAPADDTLDFDIELDTGDVLAGKSRTNSRRRLEVRLPTPRPSTDTTVNCRVS